VSSHLGPGNRPETRTEIASTVEAIAARVPTPTDDAWDDQLAFILFRADTKVSPNWDFSYAEWEEMPGWIKQKYQRFARLARAVHDYERRLGQW
jgi:hypothetical protein